MTLGKSLSLAGSPILGHKQLLVALYKRSRYSSFLAERVIDTMWENYHLGCRQLQHPQDGKNSAQRLYHFLKLQSNRTQDYV